MSFRRYSGLRKRVGIIPDRKIFVGVIAGEEIVIIPVPLSALFFSSVWCIPNQNIATRSNYCVSCQLALGTDSAKFSATVELSLLLAIQPCLMSHNYVSIFAYVFGALSGGKEYTTRRITPTKIVLFSKLKI